MHATFRQEDIDDLFTDLKVIGQIKQADRIATRGAQIRIDTTGMLQPLRRWAAGEGREATSRGIKRILSQVNAIIDLSMTSVSETHNNILRRLHTELESTVRGLTNLRTTYEDDGTMSAALSVHIENVQRKRASVSEHLHLPVANSPHTRGASRHHADIYAEDGHDADVEDDGRSATEEEDTL